MLMMSVFKLHTQKQLFLSLAISTAPTERLYSLNFYRYVSCPLEKIRSCTMHTLTPLKHTKPFPFPIWDNLTSSHFSCTSSTQTCETISKERKCVARVGILDTTGPILEHGMGHVSHLDHLGLTWA